METFQIIIIIIGAVLIFLHFRGNCLEYFSESGNYLPYNGNQLTPTSSSRNELDVSGLNPAEKVDIFVLMSRWRLNFLPTVNEVELEKVLTNYAISKHNIQLKRFQLRKLISDQTKGIYWINNEIADHLELSATDEKKLNAIETDIEEMQNKKIFDFIKPFLATDYQNILGTNLLLEEMKNNLQYMGCMIKQKVMKTLIQNNYILPDQIDQIWFNC